MIELRALNLHWLEDSEAERDLCAHSSVYLKIGSKIVSDENSGDWTVSASAYYLLDSLKENHDGSIEPQLLPCCGFNMYAVGNDNGELLIIGCSNGINWTITHEQNKVIHQIGGEILEMDFGEWRNAVIEFSDSVMNFYEMSSPKIVDDEEDKKGFELFIKEWKRLRAEAFE